MPNRNRGMMIPISKPNQNEFFYAFNSQDFNVGMILCAVKSN